MPAQDPWGYSRNKTRSKGRRRGVGPQGSGWAEDSPGYNFLAQGNRRVGNNLGGQIARGQVLKRKQRSSSDPYQVVGSRRRLGSGGRMSLYELTIQRKSGKNRRKIGLGPNG